MLEDRELESRELHLGGQIYGYLDRHTATWKRGLQLPSREAGPPNYLDDKVDLDR